jgi:hypothetical protein
VRPDFRVYGNALNEYRRFFESNPSLFAGLLPLAPVAVLAFPEQSWLGNPAHMGSVRTATRELSERHVLFEFVSEDRLSPEALSQTGVVLAPDLACLSDDRLACLETWVRGGGTLIVTGAFGTRDEAMRERETSGPLLECLQGIDEQSDATLGKGRVVKAADVRAAAERIAATHNCAPEQSGETGRALRINAYVAAPGDSARREVVHLVNYNVTLGATPPEWKPLEGVELALPLPAAWTPKQARIHRPDDATVTTVPVRIEGARCLLTIPRIAVYAVVELAP